MLSMVSLIMLGGDAFLPFPIVWRDAKACYFVARESEQDRNPLLLMSWRWNFWPSEKFIISRGRERERERENQGKLHADCLFDERRRTTRETSGDVWKRTKFWHLFPMKQWKGIEDQVQGSNAKKLASQFRDVVENEYSSPCTFVV